MSSWYSRRVVLGNDLAELRRLAGWIEGWSQRVSPEMSFAIALCLEEAVANVIMYGAATHEQLEITVDVAGSAEKLRVCIEDDGRHFDPTRVPPATLPTSLDEAKVGNLGIHLMRSFASGMHYERRDGRNRLTLEFLEPRADPQQPG
jgi:serine/threonine-protein kinase RsbW